MESTRFFFVARGLYETNLTLVAGWFPTPKLKKIVQVNKRESLPQWFVLGLLRGGGPRGGGSLIFPNVS